MQSGDGHMHESERPRRDGVRRIQLVHELCVHEWRLHRHGERRDVHAAGPVSYRRVQHRDWHVREYASERDAVQ